MISKHTITCLGRLRYLAESVRCQIVKLLLDM